MYRQIDVENEIGSSEFYSLYKDLEKGLNEGIHLNNLFAATMASLSESPKAYRELNKSCVYLNYALDWYCQLADMVVNHVDEPDSIPLSDQVRESKKKIDSQKDQLQRLKDKRMPIIPDQISSLEQLSLLIYRLHLTLSRVYIKHKNTFAKVHKSKVVYKYADHNLVEAEIFLGGLL